MAIDYGYVVDQWLWATGTNMREDVLEQLAHFSDDEIAQELWDAWADPDTDPDWDKKALLEAVASVRRSYIEREEGEE